MRERWLNIALIAVVAQIPFELQYTFLGLSNLQWSFVLLAALAAPGLLSCWEKLKTDRMVIAAAVFVSTQWLAAFYAPEFNSNAAKAAIRFSAGLALLVITRVHAKSETLRNSWAIASTAAAVYALLAYGGWGYPRLFRVEEFYIGQIRRLSGSFEYPNTAAAYFAISLPIVWWGSLPRIWRWISGALLWSALILTFSRGGLVAVTAVAAGSILLARRNRLEWRRPAGLIVAGLAAVAGVILFNPYLPKQLTRSGDLKLLSAEYEAPWNSLRQQPGTLDEVQLKIRNTGVLRWASHGRARIALSFRCLDDKTKKFVNTPLLITNLPHDVEPGQSVEVAARFQTPHRPGKYILALELFRQDFDWFSRRGVIPLLLEAEIGPSVERSVARLDLPHLYQIGEVDNALTASVPRSALWQAAWRMFVEHPFGVGPDNFRLHFGKYLGASSWDTRIRSNSTYLELLTGSGILGLVAFGLIFVTLRWRLEPVCLALAVFLIHGMVDVFLMATPIYFAFWILAGYRAEVTSMHAASFSRELR